MFAKAVFRTGDGKQSLNSLNLSSAFIGMALLSLWGSPK